MKVEYICVMCNGPTNSRKDPFGNYHKKCFRDKEIGKSSINFARAKSPRVDSQKVIPEKIKSVQPLQLKISDFSF